MHPLDDKKHNGQEKHEALPAVMERLSENHCDDMQRSFTFLREVAVETLRQINEWFAEDHDSKSSQDGYEAKDFYFK